MEDGCLREELGLGRLVVVIVIEKSNRLKGYFRERIGRI